MSPFIIGLIVLGIDPEESIASIVGAFNGLPCLAVGNVIGNSILSLALCFALSAFFHKIELKSISSVYFFILYASMVAILFSFFFQFGLFIFGLTTIGIYIIYLIRNLKYIVKEETLDVIDMKEILEEIEEEKERLAGVSKKRKILLASIGLIFVFIGGEILVNSQKTSLN